MEILSRSLIIINVNTNAGNRTFNFVISNSLTSPSNYDANKFKLGNGEIREGNLDERMKFERWDK